MTTASKITLARVVMIPVFMTLLLLGYRYWAFGVFVLASLTDMVDGYVARHYNQVSDFGKFVDPLADKLLVVSCILVFTEWGRFPSWAAMIVLARISVPLPFTPVPVSLGTLGALSVGATLGARRGLVSVAAYALLGIAGAPVFTGTNVGWAFASFGYILGYFLVAAIAGLAAHRGADRRVLTWEGDPIPNLYCVGEIASVLKFVYQGGGNLTECLVYGRNTGKLVAKLPDTTV